MGHRIISQNIEAQEVLGIGHPLTGTRADIKHLKEIENETVKGIVQEIVRDPARTAPVGLVALSSGEMRYILVSKGSTSARR